MRTGKPKREPLAPRADAPRRERRAFTEEFKRHAVQLMYERRAAGVPLTQVGRELDVRADQLREWARRVADRDGGLAAAGVIETPEQELTRLRRENARLKEEREFAKKVAVYFARESR
jgi:transposase-like protein